MKTFILLLTILTTNLFAVDSSIYTWGYGEIFYKVLVGVTILSGESYLFKIALGVGALLIMIRDTVNNASSNDVGMAMGKYLIFVVLVLGLFVETKKNYIVEDEVTGQTFPVANVPLGIGETFSMFTMLERSLGKAFETAFATPNSISYSKVGLGFTMSAPLNLGQSYFIDPYTNRNFYEYIDNCVISAIVAGDKNGDMLSTSKDLVTDLKVVGYLTPYYSSTTPNGIDKTCEDTWDLLKNDIGIKLSTMEETAAAKSMIEQTSFETGMAETTKLLFGVSQTSKNYLMQQTLINMTKSGLQAATLATGGDASAIAYAKALSETNQQQTWEMTGILAQQNLPLMKAVFTILVLGIFMLLVILSIVNGDLGHIKMGFTLLFAMVLWTPLAIIINAMFNIAIERIIPTISSGGLSMVNINDTGSNLKNYLAFLGYLASSIPVFAYAIAKKSEHGFVSFFGGVGGASTSAASSATSQTSSGNLSAGNSRLGTFNAVDQHGSHDFLGGDGWRHQSLSSSGAMNSSNVNGAGAGTIHTDAAGNADIKMDRQSGKVLSVGGLAVSTGVADSINTAQQVASSQVQTDGIALNNAFANNLTNGLSKSGTEIDTTTVGKNWGVSEQTNTTLTSALNEAAKKTFGETYGKGEKFTFTGENGVSGTVSAGAGLPDWLTNATGFKFKADGSMVVSGKSSEGKDYSYTVSGGNADEISKSFNKNVSETFGKTVGLTKALAEQAQTTKGFNDSDVASASDTYTKSWSQMDTLTNSVSVGSNNQMTFSQDLNPQIMNKLIDNATYDNHGQKVKLSELRDGNDEQKALAATFAARMMKSPEYTPQVMDAFQDVVGQKVDFTKTQGVNERIEHEEVDYRDLKTSKVEDGKEIVQTVTNRVENVPTSLQDVPKNQNDIDVKEKQLTTQYATDETKFEADAKKDLKNFEKKEALNLEKVIEQKNGTLENDVDKAEDRVNIKSAAIANPALKNLKQVGEVIKDALPTPSTNTNTFTGEKVEPKVNTDALVKRLDDKGIIDHNYLGNSEIKDWNKIEQLPLSQIQALKKFDDWSPQDDKRLDNIIAKHSKEIKNLKKAQEE